MALLCRLRAAARGLCRKRHASTAFVASYERHGNPADVLKWEERQLADPLPGEALLKMLAAPLHPADFNTVAHSIETKLTLQQIEGVYPLKPALPAVGGGEGLAQIIKLCSPHPTLKEGDWVVPTQPGTGTWRSLDVRAVDTLHRLPNDLPLVEAATLCVNPSTAFRMLEDFKQLEAGDCVVQNGSTSAVGLAVMQLCKARGIKTVNLFRARDTEEASEATRAHLQAQGGDIVLTERECRSPALVKEKLATLPKKPQLGLNCVGGRSSHYVMRMLGHGGALVTYGGMAKEPVPVAAGLLIFNDLHLHGFWLSRWTTEQSVETRGRMLDELAQYVRDGVLKSQVEDVPFCKEGLETAVQRAAKGFRSKKLMFKFD